MKIINPPGIVSPDVACDRCGEQYHHNDPLAKHLDLCPLCVQNLAELNLLRDQNRILRDTLRLCRNPLSWILHAIGGRKHGYELIHDLMVSTSEPTALDDAGIALDAIKTVLGDEDRFTNRA